MSLSSFSFRSSASLRTAMELKMQRDGFISMASYLKTLVRRDCLDTDGQELASLALKLPEARHDDLDAALLRVLEAPEPMRPRLINILTEATRGMINPRTRRDLQSAVWHSVLEKEGAA